MKNHFETYSGVYVISEVGINHNGSMEEAKKLIHESVEAGANGVKIQVRHLESIYTRAVLEDPLKAEQGTQYLLSELKKAQFSFDQVIELKEFARQFKVDFFATPFDITSARFLDDIGMNLFKIGSPDFTNLPLLDAVVKFGKPMILSTGMSDEDEIHQVIRFLKSSGANFSLLHCNSTYPASDDTINLNYLPVLREISGVKVGYSGHEQGYAPTLAAVALGARIVERHITHDRMQSGPDHRASLTSSEFTAMVREIRIIEQALGKPHRICNQGERNNRLSLAKSLVASKNLSAGTTLSRDDIAAKTPAKGISPLKLDEFVGKVLTRDLEKDDYLFFDDLSRKDSSPEIRPYKINKTWGIVGRLNDFRDFLDLKPDLVEIHMTWRDIVNYEPPKESSFPQNLVVHAPEYFQDKLIDFTSEESKIKDLSLEMLQRTIQIARDLAPRFKGMTDPRGPRVVVHPGGHFAKLTDSNKTEQYRLLKKHLREIDSEGVQLLVENMPPRPWYFGGQWYNTVFMDPKEIAQFAEDMRWGVCYDTSHAQLFCHSAGIDLPEFTRTLLPHIQYLHISDARGMTEEGLQMGAGEIDFEQFFAMIKNIDTGFIPEIWQGHLNRGQGFKEALGYIEKVLCKVSSESCSNPDHTHRTT